MKEYFPIFGFIVFFLIAWARMGFSTLIFFQGSLSLGVIILFGAIGALLGAMAMDLIRK